MSRVTTVAIACVSAVALLSAQSQTDLTEQFTRASAFYEDGKYSDALKAFVQASESPDASVALGARKGTVQAALRIGEFTLARRTASILSTNDADAEALTLSGDALWAAGFFDEADREYARHVRQYKGVDTTGDELYPYPGHNKIFLTALDRAVAVAKKSGGLSAFHHIDYRYGDLRIYFEFRRDDFSEAAYDKIDKIVAQARSKSRSVCILCGARAAPSPRVQTHGAPLPFCDAHDANLARAMINLEY